MKLHTFPARIVNSFIIIKIKNISLRNIIAIILNEQLENMTQDYAQNIAQKSKIKTPALQSRLAGIFYIHILCLYKAGDKSENT